MLEFRVQSSMFREKYNSVQNNVRCIQCVKRFSILFVPPC
jgi:hypothetical protein